MTFKIGLTGSIGMGKSTTAQMFAELGCAVWDADAAVARLYAPGGLAIAPLKALLPEAIDTEGVNRSVLRAALRNDPTLFPELEAIVHPLVRQDRETFLTETQAEIVVFDIPLLFETGGDRDMDATVCVTVSPELQRERVLARNTMSEEDLQGILAKQMPNAEKVARATYVVETETLEGARSQVAAIVAEIKDKRGHA